MADRYKIGSVVILASLNAICQVVLCNHDLTTSPAALISTFVGFALAGVYTLVTTGLSENRKNP